MRIERLVSMANDIGHFFDAEPDKAEAAKNIAGHLRRFWDPRMRREMIAHYQQGGHGLDTVVRSAVGILALDAPPEGQRAEGKGQREG
jgi:formate dehydrogenase subunit delta